MLFPKISELIAIKNIRRINERKIEWMNSILIKPHHFIDIIKLYGSGIDRFVPDEKMGHDFYKVANEIIDNPSNWFKTNNWWRWHL